MNPKTFLDWLTSVDHFFAWHQLTEGRKVQFASAKLKGAAQMWWARTQEANRRSGRGEVTTQDEMKTLLKGRFLPMDYQQSLFLKFHLLHQGSETVDEYTEKFLSCP